MENSLLGERSECITAGVCLHDEGANKMKLSFDNDPTLSQRFPCKGKRYIDFRERDFESECFENRTAEILDWNVEDFAGTFREMLEEEGFKHGDFLYMRLSALDIVRVHDAEKAGFYYAETSVFPFLRMRSWEKEPYKRYIWPTERVGSELIGSVEEIAHATFRGLRFNLDPHITEEQADRRYLRWLRNAYDNGEDIQAIRFKDKVAGFALLRDEGQGKVVWRLAGMHPELKTAGIGMILYASTVAYCKDQGYKHIDGGISMSNTPVLNVLSSVGFSFKEPTIVLHYYVS